MQSLCARALEVRVVLFVGAGCKGGDSLVGRVNEDGFAKPGYVKRYMREVGVIWCYELLVWPNKLVAAFCATVLEVRIVKCMWGVEGA